MARTPLTVRITSGMSMDSEAMAVCRSPRICGDRQGDSRWIDMGGDKQGERGE